MKNWLEKYKLHILVWTIFVGYETVLINIMMEVRAPLQVYFAHYGVIILMFYVLGDYFLPWFAKQRYKLLLALFFFCAYLVVYILLHFLADVFLMTTSLIPKHENYGFDRTFIIRNVYRGIYFLGFATGYSFIKNYLQERKKTEELEKEKLFAIIKQQQIEQELVHSQNAFLKAQISPHFLFNTLDFVYHQVNDGSPLAGEAIVRLAQMMRHAISAENVSETVPLADEIEQVENLISLYQLKQDEILNLEFHSDPEIAELRLVPLVLLTLVENVFKHGDLTNPEDKAIITIGINNKHFFIETRNLTNANRTALSHHAGLQNIKKRLLYAYGDAFELEHGKISSGHYHVNLSIPVSCLKMLSESSMPIKDTGR